MRPFGVIMAERMAREGLSQRALAKILGVQQPSLHAWLSGKRPLPANHLPLLLQTFTHSSVAERDELEAAALLTGGTPELVAYVAPLLDAHLRGRGKARSVRKH